MFIHRKDFPNSRKIQIWPKDPVSREHIKKNLQVTRKRSYIVPGLVLNKAGFFAVPKGVGISIVYNDTK